MAKQLNVNLAFTADASQAQRELQSLQKQLSQIGSGINLKSDINNTVTLQIQQASLAAADLKAKLTEATNVNTGKLDLTQFAASLQKSGVTLKDYQTKLSALGATGQQAFASLASSIMQAEIPLKRTGTLLTQFKTTLANTARWQISSSVLHGLMSGLSGAYGYAQDLNESLNNIRIVTGQTTDQMAKFAEQANQAAKALSTTTTSYTDAALIFAQQGLTGKDMTDRTDVAIKLANVTGQTASEISDQMTAIWNNFDDGSESLEHYADVITNLGAHTASSSKEIAEGLGKFAAVADTVGLSYDYATTALATVVAQTRQSADTVGTAFKTIFSRMESLKLGDTLEDGTDLGQYSEALYQVGVNIKDVNGQIKSMDTILDETGARWQTLASDEKVALAQAVAGVRQYQQFIALMDNWDTFQENLGYAEGSDGALQKQADIYAESWEAASKRVKAAAQSIYAELLDDDAFIDILNNFEKILEFVDKMIDGFGGLKGVLATVATAMTAIYGKEMATGINNMVFNLGSMMGINADKAISMKKEAATIMANYSADPNANYTDKALAVSYQEEGNLQLQLIDNAKYLSEEELKRNQALLDQNKALGEQVRQYGQMADELERVRQEKLAETTYTGGLFYKADGTSYDPLSDYSNNVMHSTAITTNTTNMSEVLRGSILSTNAGGSFDVQYADVSASINRIIAQSKELTQSWQDSLSAPISGLEEKLKVLKEKADGTFDGQVEDVKAIVQYMDEIQNTVAKNKLTSREELLSGDNNTGNNRTAVSNAKKDAEAAGTAMEKTEQGMNALRTSSKLTSEELKQTVNSTASLGEVFVGVAGGISSLSMAMSMLSNITNSLNDPDTSGWEKFLQVTMSLGMAIPLLTTSMTSLKKAMNFKGISDSWKALKEAKVAKDTATKNAEEAFAQAQANRERAQNEVNQASSNADKAQKQFDEARNKQSNAQKKVNKASIEYDQAKYDEYWYNKNSEYVDDDGKVRHVKQNNSKASAHHDKNARETLQGRVDKSKKNFDEASEELSQSSKDMNASQHLVAETAAEKEKAAAKLEGAVANEANTKTELDNAVAGKTEEEQNYKTATSQLFKNAAVLAAVIVIGLIIAAVYAYIKAQKKEEEQAKAARQAANELAEQYEDLKQKAEDVKTAFEEYNTLVDTLESCKKGTTEWYEALNNVNTKVLELLKEYPELAKYVERSSTGQLSISAAGQKEYQEKVNQQAQDALVASTLASANASKLELKADKTKLTRSITSTGNSIIDESSYNAGSGTYDTYGEGAKAAELMMKNIDSLSGLTGEEFEKKLTELFSTGFETPTEKLVASMKHYQDSIDALANDAKSAEDEMKAAYLAAGTTELGGAYNQEAINMAANMASKEYETKYEEAMVKSNQLNVFSSKEAAQDLWDDYSEASGTNYHLASNAVRGTDENRSYAYIDENGDEKTISAEAVASTIAAAQAMEELGSKATEASQMLAQMKGEGADAIKSWIASGDFSNMEESDIKAMQAAIGDLDNSEAVKSYLKGEFGVTTDEDFQKRAEAITGLTGQEAVDRLLKDFANDLSTTAEAFNSVGKNLTGTAKKAYEGMQGELDNESLNTRTQVSNLLDRAVTNNGTEGVEGVSTVLNKALDAGKIEKFADIATGMDWSTEGLTAFKEKLKEAGIEIGATDAELEAFVDGLGEFEGGPKTMDELAESYSTASSAAESLLNNNNLSAKNYEELGDEWQGYFTKMADGTYQLTCDAETFYNLVKQNQIDELNKAKEETQALIDKGNALQEKYSGEEGIDSLTKSAANMGAITGYDTSTGTYIQSMNGYDTAMVEDQLAFLETINVGVASYQDTINSGGQLTKAQLEEIANLVLENKAAWDTYDDTLAEYKANNDDANNAMATMSENLNELNAYTKDLDNSQEAYNNGLIKLGSQYTECKDEVRAYTDAVGKYGKDSTQAKTASEKLNKAIKQAEWTKATKAIAEYQKKIEDTKDVSEMEEAYSGIATTLNETFNTNVTSDWVKENQDLLKEWYNSSGEEAQENAMKVQNAAAAASASIEGMVAEGQSLKLDINDDGYIDVLNTDEQLMLGLKSIVEGNPITLTANGEADLTNLVNSLLEAGVQAEWVAAYLASIGQTDVKLEGISGETLVGDLTSEEGIKAFIDSLAKWKGEIKAVTGEVPAQAAADMTGVKQGSGGGSSSKVERKESSDEITRYKEIDDSLEDLAHTMKEVNAQSDRLYGASKIKNLEKQNKLIQKQIGLDQQKIKEAKKYLGLDKEYQSADSDKGKLDAAAAKYGIQFSYDDDGDISNYTAVMGNLEKSLNEKIAQYNAQFQGTTNSDAAKEYEEANIKPIEDQISELQGLIDKYDETKKTVRELEEEQQELYRQWQDNNYEELSIELEVNLQVNENWITALDYYVDKLSDDVYKAAESLEFLVEKFDAIEGNMNEYTAYVNDLKEAYDNGEISQEKYVEGMQKAYEATYQQLKTLNELKKQMEEYYANTITKANEEIGKYTSRMENLNKTLDHYQKILQLTGQEKNYTVTKDLYQAQADNYKNLYETNKNTYEMYSQQKVEIEEKYNKAIADGDMDAAEFYKKQLDEATEAADEAHDKMLTSAENYLETLKKLMQEKLKEAGESYEKSVTGSFGTFDELTESMDRVSTRQDEYLTKTNQIYETNKMLNTLQRDMDKTDSAVAKKKYKAFADEIEQLQKKGELSNLELEIAQAKYTQLQAEIALEDAQNAKSQVRLQRDSEGNYGYVYTADQDAIDEAEQNLADAANNVYNIELEAANNYAEKIIQTRQEMMNKIKAIWEDESLTEEEKVAKSKQVQEEYYDILETYQDLYGIATTDDANVIVDAWSSAYSDIIDDSETFKEETDGYMDEAQSAVSECEGQVNEFAKDSKLDADSIAADAKKVTEESAKLATEVNDDVIPKLNSELEKVLELTDAYAKQISEINAKIEAYEKLAASIQKVIEAESELDNDDGDDEEEEETSSGPGSTGSPATGDTSGSNDSGNSGSGGSTTPETTQEEATKKRVESREPIPYNDHTIWKLTYNTGEVTYSAEGKEYSSLYKAKMSYKETGASDDEDLMDKVTGTYGYYEKRGSSSYVIYTDKGIKKGTVYTKTQAIQLINNKGLASMKAFDTGGYTGEWGTEGRVAVLHEKELVLNQDDTENFLQALAMAKTLFDSMELMSVYTEALSTTQSEQSLLSGYENTSSDLISLLSTMIDANAAYSSQSLSSLSATDAYAQATDAFNQNVTITAEFPNAVNHSEIEEAFDTLINRASQFANRKSL